MPTVGILLSFGALVCWGLGDFLIQKESRLAGVWQTLFYNTLIAAVVLAPFALGDLSVLGDPGVLKFFIFVAVITLVVAGLEFEAFRRGKMAIVEPIMAFELPLTVLLGITLGAEILSFTQGIIIVSVFFGIFLLAYRTRGGHSFFERGAILAVLSALVMAGVNYFTGRASQEAGAVFTIWFIDVLLLFMTSVVLFVRGEVKTIIPNLMKHPWTAISMAIVDNAAWLFYAFAVTLIPISIVVTISESYIILAILLGVLFNRERIKKHQWFGAGIAVCGVMVLSFI